MVSCTCDMPMNLGQSGSWWMGKGRLDLEYLDWRYSVSFKWTILNTVSKMNASDTHVRGTLKCEFTRFDIQKDTSNLPVISILKPSAMKNWKAKCFIKKCTSPHKIFSNHSIIKWSGNFHRKPFEIAWADSVPHQPQDTDTHKILHVQRENTSMCLVELRDVSRDLCKLISSDQL